MDSFQEVGRQWARMCKAFRSLPNGCSGCPLVDEHCYHESPFVLDFDRIEYAVMQWAEENPEPVYPTWGEWLLEQGVVRAGTENRNGFTYQAVYDKLFDPIDAEIAEKLRLRPKEAV